MSLSNLLQTLPCRVIAVCFAEMLCLAGIQKVVAQGNPSHASQASEQTSARNLAALTQPLWIDLTPTQQQALAPFARKWNTFSTAEKRSWIKASERFASLSGEQRARLQSRMKEWAELSPEQRNRARANFNLAANAPKDRRVAEYNQYKEMTPEQRQVLQTAGRTSNTAAGYAGTRTGLAVEAAQPFSAANDAKNLTSAKSAKQQGTKAVLSKPTGN